MKELERDCLELRLAEQAILRQALEEKNARTRELEAEVRTLRSLLSELAAAPRPQYAPAPAAAPRTRGAVPLRWKA
ncbi:MAG TPA: hypothetical protein P5079_02755 [Elusimicrobiota bacterium]|nr:hypothetical protein [Elusimicrobiota bacterium]